MTGAPRRLPHELRTDGRPDEMYDPGPPCPFTVPGGDGAVAWLLRSWTWVLRALREPEIRDLRAIEEFYAAAGVTLQHPDGLLRRSSPDTDIRAVINPYFTAAAAEPWRQPIRDLAVALARKVAALTASGAVIDLGDVFCGPLIAQFTTLVAGLEPGEWDQLLELSNRTTGTLVLAAGDRSVIRQAWDELYLFCGPLIERMRSQDPNQSVMHQVIHALARAGRPDQEVLHAVTTIFNGWPTGDPIARVVAAEIYGEETAGREGSLATCTRNPELWPMAIWEALRRRAHFTFALPGQVRADITIDDVTIPAGSVVLPGIHSAEMDPARTLDPGRFSMWRPRKAILAFGAGVHVCPGKALMLVAEEEGHRALAAENPSLRLAIPPDQMTWRRGTVPVPERIPVTGQQGPPFS